MQSTSFELNPQIVKAGAGAGKTTALTNNIYSSACNFRQSNGRWPRVVATTFTRKATQELKERLKVKAIKENDFHFLEYMSSSNDIHISTIHGVLSLFLKRYGHLMNWDSNFQLMGPAESTLLIKKEMKAIVFQPRFKKLIEGFGFSNLSTLIQDLYEIKLSHSDAKPFSKLDLDRLHTEHVIQWLSRMHELCEYVLQSGAPEKWISFYSSCSKVIDNHLKSKNPDLTEVWQDIEHLGKRPVKTKEMDKDFSDEVKNRWNGLKEEIAKPYFQKDFNPQLGEIYLLLDEVADFVIKGVLEKKRESGQLEMRDLELLVAKFKKEDVELVRQFSKEWDYWLIDEFQDTSPLQNELLRELIGEKPVYIVGDPQQSIYLFRGARSEVFLNKEKEFKDHMAEPLLTNYRSEPALMEFLNDFFSGFEQSFIRMQTHPEKDPPSSQYEAAQFFLGEDLDSELKFLKNEVINLVNDGVSLSDICVLSRKHKHLMRASSHINALGLSTQIHASSGFVDRREVLDASCLLKFLVNPKDNENLAMLVRSPWVNCSDKDLVELATKTSDYNKETEQNVSWWEAWSSVDDPSWLNGLNDLKDLLGRVRHEGLLMAFEYALINLGIVDYSHKQDSTGRRESNIWKFVHLLREAERQPGFNPLDFLDNVCSSGEDVDASAEGDALAASEPNAIQFMTIHGSKGLQFPYVFVVHCHENPNLSGSSGATLSVHRDEKTNKFSFPCPIGEHQKEVKSIADHLHLIDLKKRELHESDRLFYVALTRASKRVYLSSHGQIQKESWMARSGWDFSEGEVVRDSYRYLVAKSNNGELKSLNSLDLHSSKEPAPWSETNMKSASKSEEKVSVSSLLQKKFKQGEFSEEVFEESSEVKESFGGLWVQPDTFSQDESNHFFGKNILLAEKGVVVHKIFEKLHYDLNFDINNFVDVLLPNEKESVLEAISWTMEQKSPPMRSIIQNGFVEWGFQMKTSQGTMEGQIDLWGEDSGETWLIDYKTGSSKGVDKAITQLGLYSLALRELGKDNIKLAVVFPFGREIVTKSAPSADEVRSEFNL